MSDLAHDTPNEPVEETMEQLSGIAETADVGDSEGSGGGTTDEATVGETVDESVATLLQRAEGAVESLLSALSDGTATEARDDFEELRNVVEETGELLETVDLTEVPGAIDYDDVDDAVDASDIPDAIAEGDVDEAVRYSKLLTLIEFDELLDTVDIRSFRQNKEELDAAVEEFVDDRDEDSGWIVFDALEWLVETASGVGGDGGDGIAVDVDAGETAELASDGQVKQIAMQSKLRETVEEFRESVFEAHERMKELREQANEQVTEKTGDIDQPSSRNPTAYSTLPSTERSRLQTQFSTVPRNTRYSTASNPPRIYGSRFESRRDDDE